MVVRNCELFNGKIFCHIFFSVFSILRKQTLVFDNKMYSQVKCPSNNIYSLYESEKMFDSNR